MDTYSVEVFDNFISDEDHKKICDKMLTQGFMWEYSKHKVFKGQEHGFRDHMLVHMFHAYNGHTSPDIELVNPILYNINALSVHRIKANLELYSGDTQHKSNFHLDWSHPITKKGCRTMTIGIYYVNTNNGYTEFEDGSRVESVANRFIRFAGDLKHRGVNQTDTKERIVINFNYFRDLDCDEFTEPLAY